MTEGKNIRAVIAAQAVAVLSDQRGSLVGRGLAALRKDNDALYRQARMVVSQGFEIDRWNEKDNPAISSAFKIFQQLSAENYCKAYWPLSILYRGKRDIEEDQDRAQHFAQMAFDWCFANQANQDAELWRDLGNMYCKGWGVAQNDEQAANWYRKAAEQGDSVGQYNFGWMYEHGRGVPQEDEEAVKWYRLAADQGDADAQFILGEMYMERNGVSEDFEESMRWCRLAADQGHAKAKGRLALLALFEKVKGKL